MKQTKCEYCKKIFEYKPSPSKWGKKRFCSRICAREVMRITGGFV